MSVQAFEKCHKVTGAWEGGWSDHPSDPGGKTMYGITIAKYREHFPNATGAQLKSISKATALTIYRKDFWVPISGETLAAGVDLAVYDASVNSGVSRGKKWLKASVGGSNVETVKRICAKRLGFMQSLKIWKSFGKGWSRRVADIEAKGVAWALAASNAPKSVKPALEAEAKKAESKAKTQEKSGAGVGAGGAVASPEAADQLAGLAMCGFVVLAVAVVAYLIWRSRINKQRAAAYKKEAAQ
jgi:lysozyme family protein